MTSFFLFYGICCLLMPLALVFNEGFCIPPLALIAYLIRRQAILEQQVAHLLTKDSTRETVKAWRDEGLKQVDRVKGV